MKNTIVFGKGEYALTTEKLPKLAAKLDAFEKTGVWQWALVDCLGIGVDGNTKPRYSQILNHPSDNAEFNAFKERLRAYVKPANISHPTKRTATPSASAPAKPTEEQKMAALSRVAEGKASYEDVQMLLA